MKKIHKKYIHRQLEYALHLQLDIFAVVGVTGPRQSGKSTMLREVLSDYQYVTFDDYRIKELFYNDREQFISIYNDKVIFDEVHHVPELFPLIKHHVDKKPEVKGRFILTGSAQFNLMKNVSESLAGRIGLLTLLPFSRYEISDYVDNSIEFKGSYPELIMRAHKQSQQWYSAYIETYLQKDIRGMGQVGDLRDFSRLLSLLAARTSQQLNMSELSKDLGVAVNTIKRWISILEATYIIFLLPPFYKNFGKRIIKAPKLYFWDTGLVSFLTGIETDKLYNNGPMAVAIFENYVIAEIFKNIKHNNIYHELFYFRTNHGEEIDLIVDKKTSKDLIEIKKSMTFKSSMVKHISKYMSDNDSGYLLYSGEHFPYVDNIHIEYYNEYFEKQGNEN